MVTRNTSVNNRIIHTQSQSTSGHQWTLELNSILRSIISAVAAKFELVIALLKQNVSALILFNIMNSYLLHVLTAQQCKCWCDPTVYLWKQNDFFS